ncbi:MAG: polymer-forming cytoskeletal protein [Pseudomonadota bacterium]
MTTAPQGLEGSATLIASGTRLVGNINFSSQIYIHGIVDGDVVGEETDAAVLIVCEGGVVRGEVRAPNVVVDGSVEGNVYASGKLELASKARINGDVHYNLVEMQLGSVVNGRMVSLAEELAGPRADKAAAQHKPAAQAAS